MEDIGYKKAHKGYLAIKEIIQINHIRNRNRELSLDNNNIKTESLIKRQRRRKNPWI